MWDESKHPRDEHGQFAKSGTPRTYRQNASYSEITRSSEDAELSAFNEYIAKKLCEAFGIDPGEDSKQSFYDYFDKKQRERALTIENKRPNEFKVKSKYLEDFREGLNASAPGVIIPYNHFSRLKVMWSDYEQGKCKPPEKNGTKYFNVDNTIYLTVGEYPNFYVTHAKRYKYTFKVEKALKRFKYGK